MNATAFAARYPGRCLCGSSFSVGARIYWDSSVRRATGCPACAPRKAIPGTPINLKSGLVARFDLHPSTREICACIVTDPCGAWNACEVYALTGGGPAGRTDLLAHRIYAEAFGAAAIGRAAVMALVLFLLLVGFTVVQHLYFRNRVTYDIH